MKKISILVLILLSSCSVLQKDQEEIKKIGHDVVDAEVDNAGK